MESSVRAIVVAEVKKIAEFLTKLVAIESLLKRVNRILGHDATAWYDG